MARYDPEEGSRRVSYMTAATCNTWATCHEVFDSSHALQQGFDLQAMLLEDSSSSVTVAGMTESIKAGKASAHQFE